MKFPHEKWTQEDWCQIKEHSEYGQILIIREPDRVNIWAQTDSGLKCKSFICINPQVVESNYKKFTTDKYKLTEVVKSLKEFYRQDNKENRYVRK